MDGEQKQPRNPNDLLIFQNIDNEDFEWQYDAIKTPLPYFIRAGETRELPFYIAKHGIEKLIDKILMKQDKMHTSPIFREDLRKKIVLGLKHINYIREKTPNELALEAMQRKKDSDPYEELLKEREIAAEQLAAQEASALTPKAPLIETVGKPIQPITPQVSNPDSPVVPTATTLNNIEAPEVVPDQERQNVYNLLTTKLHMDLTHVATKEKLDATPLEQLKQEFASELPEVNTPDLAIVADTKGSLNQDGMPLIQTQPVIPKPATPAVVLPQPPRPQISMNPQAPIAPLLDQQLNQIT